ncbi:MAG TPA: PLDc N-terminal domain-containing protein [Puia sp.]|nr:PLDc N-terminal domain-containing protein [Puia sp.]
MQIICVIHCIRHNNTQRWIFFIIFVPLIGCIAYFFTEIVNTRDLGNVQSGLGTMLNPTGRIRRLENNLRFSDTFNNRVMLADAYLGVGRVDEAIELYTSSLTGAFTENDYVFRQLISAYFIKQRYKDLIPLAQKISNHPEFARSRAHIQYACALGYAGDSQGAEREFKKMKSKFSAFEARYEYGLFLQRLGRTEEARHIFRDMTEEAPHLSARERRSNRAWILKAKEELRSTYSSFV